MKLLEVEISNVRGIVHEVLFLEGKNLVIWGPNGSGKSAVVDAIDFLLTGRVSRLSGKGTGQLSLSKHGPHIDRTPAEAVVRAKIKLPGVTQPIEIKRCMATPSRCEYEKSMKDRVEPLMKLAQRGQHVLTRREVLKFVTAEANTRAQEIQELLDITEIEETRKALVTVKNSLSRETDNAKQHLDTDKRDVNATVQKPDFKIQVVLEVVNQNRAVLGGEPISELHSTDLKKSIKPQVAQTGEKPVNVTLFERDIQNIRQILSETKQSLAKKDETLRGLIAAITADPALLRAFKQRELIELGRKLIDETGSCPLCETEWPPGELSEHLDHRLSTAQVVREKQDQIRQLSGDIAGVLKNVSSSLEKAIAVVKVAELEDERLILQTWVDNLKMLVGVLIAPVDKYPGNGFSATQVENLLAPEGIIDLLESIYERVKKKFPESTPEQTAWDILTRLEENIKALERSQKELQSAELLRRRAIILSDTFEKARDSILSSLYESVKDRFVELYQHLHGPDEENFAAYIQPNGPALNFDVDFHGRGPHPPHALHSEGHQDSMGLCLYLALAERLTQGWIDLIILDDVMMSVDATHRRQLCRLLNDSFPNRQFLITTHDKTWANQLKAEGVVDKRGFFEFYNWNVETGPRVNRETGMWEKIDTDLENNDIPSAAARLRRGSEEFFSTRCSSF